MQHLHSQGAAIIFNTHNIKVHIMHTTKQDKLKALKAAFPHTIPIMAGFLFMGITYGIYARTSSLMAFIPILMSITVFAGSAEFLAVGLLTSSFNPLEAFTLTLMLNARHLFYGISMLDKYSNVGLKKAYLIYGMCDETFSVNCSADIPDGVDKGWFMFFVTLLDQIYWVLGASLGSLFGSFITFNTKGLDFTMTAMFTVIMLNQWLKDDNHTSALCGFGISLLCLIIFGKDNFIIPAMILILLSLTLLRPYLEKEDNK